MAKGKNKLNKSNSSGWLDDYSEESVINQYADGGIIDTLKEFFTEKTNKPSPKSTPAKSSPKTFKIEDKRKVLATSGQPIRPNVDITSGEYDLDVLKGIVESAKRNKLSIEDAKNLAAIAFQETKFGKVDENLGHVINNIESRSDLEALTNAYITKMKKADRLGLTDEALRLQVYNGLGVIKPSTEQDYHGFKMKKIYGVPVPNEGISMKKNPLYGKQIMDLRDNVLNQNPEYVNYLNAAYNSKNPVPVYSDIELKSWGPTPTLRKFEMGGKINNDMKKNIKKYYDGGLPTEERNNIYNQSVENLAKAKNQYGEDSVVYKNQLALVNNYKNNLNSTPVIRATLPEVMITAKRPQKVQPSEELNISSTPVIRATLPEVMITAKRPQVTKNNKRFNDDNDYLKAASKFQYSDKDYADFINRKNSFEAVIKDLERIDIKKDPSFKKYKENNIAGQRKQLSELIDSYANGKFKRIKDIEEYGEEINVIKNQNGGSINKYPAGGYLDYQEGFKGFGVGPQLYQDNSYFRSIMPDNIENMEEEINKPSVFSGINDILGSVNQGVNQITGLMSQMPQPSQGGYAGMSEDAKKSFDFNKLLNFAEGKTGSNLIDTDLGSIAGRISGGMSGTGQVFGGLPGGGGSKGILQGMSLLGQKNGGYINKYQNGGEMDMLPVGSPEYIHKSNVFHENYNPVPRVHFTDDTTPFDMGVNLNDLVNMNGGRINKYAGGGLAGIYGDSYGNVSNSPRVFNSNTNRASLADLQVAESNDFLNTKMRKDRQSFEDDKIDWGFMDWSKDIAAGGLGLLSTVPVVGDVTKDIVGDSFLTRRGGYAVGKGVGNVGMGAAKIAGGIAKFNPGMIASGVGDVGEGVGSTVGTFQAKDALSNYDKSGYISGNRMVNASQDFGNMMDNAASLYGTISGGVNQMKGLGGLKGMMGNLKGGETGMKGFGNIMSKITGFRQEDGGYLNYYQEGGMVSMPEDFEIAKFKKGGLTPAKAEKMLHDKSFTTDKQRKYFGYISSQKKSSGGWMDSL